MVYRYIAKALLYMFKILIIYYIIVIDTFHYCILKYRNIIFILHYDISYINIFFRLCSIDVYQILPNHGVKYKFRTLMIASLVCYFMLRSTYIY